jgi:plasmid stabilization system protein ParE
MAEYRLSPAAERDLERIWKYTLGEWGLEQADRYTDLLTAAFQGLAESPKSAPACDHIRQGAGRRDDYRARQEPKHKRYRFQTAWWQACFDRADESLKIERCSESIRTSLCDCSSPMTLSRLDAHAN